MVPILRKINLGNNNNNNNINSNHLVYLLKPLRAALKNNAGMSRVVNKRSK